MFVWRAAAVAACVLACSGLCAGQSPALNFDAIVARFRANNPDLAAADLLTEEARANEITANLRPNPVLSVSNDQLNLFGGGPFSALGASQLIPNLSYLWERQHKRQLRTDSARLATSVQTSSNRDLERTLLFTLRDAYNRALQAKSIQQLAQENLDYYDKVIDANRTRYQAGDISELDLQRVELQRVQFQSDVVNSTQSLRTAKIQLLALMSEHRTSVDQFDVAGDFDFHDDSVLLLPEIREIATENRPDLRAAETAIRKAEADHKLAVANGTADPVFGLQYQKDAQLGSLVGLNVTVPLRIFDKNQGEKARTAVEVRRTGHVVDAVRAAVLRDVDTAYEQVQAARSLIIPYRQKYLEQAKEVRERVSFAYSKGGASLLEFLDAQKTWRDTQLAYRNLIGSYLSATAQLNLAAGKEIVK